MPDMLHSSTTEGILGGFFEVYRSRGYGFSESVYSNSLAVELGLRGLRVRREVPTEVLWKGHSVGTYRLDLVVNDCVIVEVKTCEMLCMDHERQLMNYLRACSYEVGLLLNFGPKASHRRIVYSNDRKQFTKSQSA